MTERALNLLALSELETEAHVWVGLLRDRDISLRSVWHRDEQSALTHAQTQSVDLIICSVQPSVELIQHGVDQGAMVLIFCNCSTHQAASWLGAGALSVMPYTQTAALVPIVTRALSQQGSQQSNRKTAALRSEHEARLNLLLQRSGMALAYLSDSQFLSVSDGWARWLGDSVEQLTHQSWSSALPDSIREDFQRLVGQAQLGDGAEGRITLNEVPRHLRIEPASFAGQDCLMATLTAPSTPASVDVSSRVSDGGIRRTIQALDAFISSGKAQTLALVEVKKVDLLRHSLSLVDFAELMGLTQACIGQHFDQPPEPVNDHSFMVAIAGDIHACQSKAQPLMDHLTQHTLAESLPHVEVAIALVPIQADDHDVSAVLQRGYDLAGRTEAGQISTFKPSSLELASKDPLAGLRQALAQDQCELLYQPLVALSAIEGEYYEVLTQLRDEQGQVIPARSFIRDAGRKELGRTLDEYVVHQAAQKLLSHLPRNPSTRLIINMTLASLQSQDLTHWLQSATLGISDPSCITWQFRETDIALDTHTAALHLKTLKSLGYQVACSQFGNLPDVSKLLAQCPFDAVKVDPSFVEGIKNDADKQAELKALCTKIHEAGARVIVPMVEEAAIMSALYRAGADLIQGHYLQPPELEMSYEFATEL